MRATRLLPVSPSMHCSGGGECTCPGGVRAGGVPAQGVYLLGVFLHGGCTCPGTHPPREQNDWQTGVKT